MNTNISAYFLCYYVLDTQFYSSQSVLIILYQHFCAVLISVIDNANSITNHIHVATLTFRPASPPQHTVTLVIKKCLPLVEIMNHRIFSRSQA